MSEEANTQKKSPAVIALVVAVCVVAAVLIGEGVALVLNKVKEGDAADETTTAAEPVAPVEIGDGFALYTQGGKVYIDFAKDHTQAELVTLADATGSLAEAKYASGAKRLYFTVTAAGGASNQLYTADLDVKDSKNIKAQKLSDGVLEFYVRDGGNKVVYLCAGRMLYVQEPGKDAVPVGSDADQLVASDTSKGMYYISWPGGAKSANGGPNVLYSFDDTGRSTPLDNNMYYDVSYADDHAVVSYVKGTAVYRCIDGASPASAATLPQDADSNTARVLFADADGRVYFTVSVRRTSKIGDHVNDVYKASDAQITDKDPGYAQKQKREAVRKLLNETMTAGDSVSLYCATPGGAASLIADNVSQTEVLSSGGKPRMLLFLSAPLDAGVMLSISELTDCVEGGYTVDTVSNYLLRSMSGAYSMKLLADGTVSELGTWASQEAYAAEGDLAAQIKKTFSVAPDNSAVYYVLKVNNENTLIRRVMSGGRAAAAEGFGSKLLEYYFLSAGLLTARGSSGDPSCTLYLDNVSLGAAHRTDEGHTVIDCGNGAFYFAGNYTGAPLNYYNGTPTVTVVCSNIKAAAGVGGTAVYFIDSAAGALKYYNGEKETAVASGVGSMCVPAFV